jgi:hypothetical protein
MNVPGMDQARQAACDAWLHRLGEWAGYGPAHRRAALACEVVRGIVRVTDPEWFAGLQWAAYVTPARAGHDYPQGYRTDVSLPTIAEWTRALELYGPAVSEADRLERAHQCVVAAAHGSVAGMRAATTVATLWQAR